jgi:hypothetical protein
MHNSINGDFFCLSLDEHIVDSNLHDINDEVDKTISISNLKNIDLKY